MMISGTDDGVSSAKFSHTASVPPARLLIVIASSPAAYMDAIAVWNAQ